MKKTDPPIIVQQRFDATLARVWQAITEIDQMRQWYFDNLPDFQAELGFETAFEVSHDGRNFLHQWKVTEVIPLKKLVYGWQYAQYEGKADVVFELSRHEGQTLLQVSTHINEDFPADIPEFDNESCKAGWEYFIQQRLKAYLS